MRWRGPGPSYETGQPGSPFVRRINTPFMEYVCKHKTKIQVSDSGALTRAIEGRGD